MKTSSRTAIGAATLRAAHQLMDAEPLLLKDDVILRLLEPEIIQHIREFPDLYRRPEAATMRTHVALRSRYTEDSLQQAFEKGVRQYMILGAGFDTFAYRQPAWAANLRIFEVDHPGSQAQKQQRLAETGIPLPDNLSFVPVDFERSSIPEALQQTNFNLQAPVFIGWLGVLTYLTMDAIDATLRFLGTLPAGSELVLTFSRQQSMEYFSSLANRAAAMGEPWITHFSPEELADKLHSHGFTSVSFLTTEKALPYFQGRTDGLMPPRRASLAHAII
ncbi:class I SAM-dependent methyltransferase [Chitinophaga agrisoli]|uniref:S-adenosyl-L-methionine-dependent methyltransferase n=1 Tax=Chitinophaga agrisoli TaxID=2607653 RepID=A0A5B2W1K3_9BACT|nr:class I SAM-dependent methyltransferase [Chitinophaga agrisoli]KAA2244552.1 class I SAM-dependent methyltransferase [Chitinophaga agrisoli]